MLILFGLLTVLELLIFTDAVWPVRRPLAAGLVVALALVSGGMFGVRPSLTFGLVAIISLYRAVSLLRLVQNRSEAHYLRSTARRTTIILATTQLGLLLVVLVSDAVSTSAQLWWYLLATVQLVTAIGLMVSTRRQLRTTLPAISDEHFSDSQLPAISICIPARNETQALEECLRSLIASDYPKLEVLVLDDCSQGSRTTDIIRGFAHDGVRFVQGTPPADKWLAKNWAYQQLFAASSGQLVVFCGVDVRFEPQSLRAIVTTQLSKHKRMMSLVPRNILPKGWRAQQALLIQPARYAWELCLPRRRFNRPPVLSSCWVAERKLISGAGGFGAVSGSISPEAYFARRAIVGDGYSFVQSTPELSITSYKSPRDQWDTAVRTRYPQLHRRPEMVLAVSLLEISLLVGPLVLAIIAAIQGHLLLATLGLVAEVVQCIIYGLVVRLTYRQLVLRGFWLLPLAVLLDVYIRHESLWRYEFGEVNWKGRNVCLPVMRVIPKMPKA